MKLTAEVLGPVRLSADGSPVDLGGPRQRRLLGVLVVNRGSVVSTDRLIDAVFAGDPPDAARRTFRTYVARLRRALDVAGVDESRVLVTEAKGYVLSESAVDVDSTRFEQADAPVFIRRFEVHARRIASIEHLNVVPLYDYWREPGAAYLVTRFLSGGSLAHRLTGDPITHDERMNIVRQIGSALTAAHERGIVHGQLDASCVLFDDLGAAYLTGFGLDADPRSTPTDIDALGQLATELWAQSSETSDRSSGSVAIASRVATIAERADSSETGPSIGTVAVSGPDVVVAIAPVDEVVSLS